MSTSDPVPDKVELAREQLARVQVAWLDPVDWSDLSLYGFYAVENAVAAAADKAGVAWTQNHPSKVNASKKLHDQFGLPDVSSLLVELNDLRKATAYGETQPSTSYSPEDIAIEVEQFVEAAAIFVDVHGVEE